MKVKIFILANILFFGKVFSQDLHNTQFFNNTLSLSPALAGSVKNRKYNGGGVYLAHRNQWSKLNYSVVSNTISGDYNVNNNFGNIGFLINQDEVGSTDYRSLSINAIYAYDLQLGRYSDWNAKFGLQVGFQNSNIAFDKVRFEDQIDPFKGVVRESQDRLPGQSASYFNSAISGVVHNEKVYFGYSLHNLNTPKYSFIGDANELRVPRRHSLFAGIKIEGSRDQELHIDMLYMNQKDFNDLIGGVRLNLGIPEIGAYYRRSIFNNSNADAICLTIAANFERLKIAYNSDITISSLSMQMPFSSEISIRYFFHNAYLKNFASFPSFPIH
jgi:type IX secretion system PorP/SprF family membrane protein